MDPGMVEAVRQFQESRMGVYEHCGTVGGKIGLEELVTGTKLSCICPQGTEGSPANSGMFGSARRWRTWWTTMWQ